jgi:ribosome-associated protein
MRINHNVTIPDEEITLSAVRAQGAGGQNVNKVASAIHLRFDIRASSLPDAIKHRLLQRGDQRITNEGVVVIKAQSQRTQERNRTEALERLRELVLEATQVPRKRVATRPSLRQKRKRLEAKKKRGEIKKLRGRPE